MNLRFAKIIATSMLVLSAMPSVQAYDFTVGGVYYNYTSDGKGAVVTYSDLNNNAYTGDVNIPAQVSYRMNTMTVKGIGDHAFFNCQSLKSVTLHEGVTYINEQAFSHCYAMTSITLPQSLQRIGDFAFEYCEDMTSFTIPKNVVQIGYCVFYQCLGTTGYNVDPANPAFTSADGTLYLKDMSILIQYPAGRRDTEFTIPDAVKTITDYAFSPAPALQKVTIGPNVSEIVPLTFSECAALREIEVSPDNDGLCSVDGVLFDKDVNTLLQFPISSGITEYTMPATVTELADVSMTGCAGLRSITFPASLSKIGDCALLQCSGLEKVTSLNPIPPTTIKSVQNPSGTIFDSAVYLNATLYVNEPDIATYSADSEWGRFKSIHDINSAGIAGTADTGNDIVVNGLTVSTADGAEIKAYDLYGRLAASGTGSIVLPSPGVYTIATPRAATKTAVR